MAKLEKSEIESIIKSEEMNAIGFLGDGSEIQHNRATLLKYYNQEPYGDEVEGQSKVVTSEVADTVNGILPNIMRMFTQSNNMGVFESNDPSYDKEAEQKTTYSNWVFFDQHDGIRILHDMFKDGSLQYTGVVKVFHDDSEDSEEEEYKGLSQQELMLLDSEPNFTIKKVEQDEDGTYKATGDRVHSKGRQCIVNIPPDELLISKRARDFIDPPFIGQRTPKTRSDLIAMGFDKKVVAELGRDEEVESTVQFARNDDIEQGFDSNPSNDKSKDVIYLGEYYIYMDVDQDGISELWQVFYSNGKILEMNRTDDHPYAVYVPIPMPHKAIGSCPAEQAADIQLWKSHLVRQANNNIYATNFNRVVANERVNLDDLLVQRHGGVVRIDGTQPIGDSVMPLPVMSQVPAVLEMMNYADTLLEKRTGVTSYNQGLDTESLNKTATGFQGIRDMSQMRIEQMAILASSTIKRIYELIIKNASKYQDEAVQIKVHGEPLEIDPSQWRYKTNCKINVGTGAGDVQAKVANLNALLNWQLQFMQLGLPIVDADKIYNTMHRMCIETNLKSVEPYFNDPTQPQELLMAEIERLTRENMAMQQQMQNPLAEAEVAKGQMRLAEQQQKQQHEMNMKMAEMEQKDAYHDDEMAIKLSELELQAKKDVKGSLI